MSLNAALAVSDSGTVEALKRVKATEAEWESKVAEARAHSDAAARRLRDETEAAVQAAQALADQERSQAVQAARTSADVEAQQIRAEGTKAAEAAGREDPKGLQAKRAAILAAILGEFGSD